MKTKITDKTIKDMLIAGRLFEIWCRYTDAPISTYHQKNGGGVNMTSTQIKNQMLTMLKADPSWDAQASADCYAELIKIKTID